MSARRIRTTRRIAAVVVVPLILASCSTLSLRPFTPGRHGSVYVEWLPHRDSGEWWYVTGRLQDARGGLWLYQFTIFHQAKLLGQGYLLDLALTDYTTGRHYFEEFATTDSHKAYARDGSIVFDKSSITLSKKDLTIHAKGEKLAFDLTSIPEKPPVWQADDGVEAMGLPGEASQMSYYYSFTRLRTRGEISFTDASGAEVRESVSGNSWLDRQWGTFTESGWDWFSIRLFDGNDVMLYAFPPTGFREGTLADPQGKTTTFRDFAYTTDRWQTRGQSRYGLEWSLQLPVLGRELKIVALSRNDFNPNRVIAYWEGLCRVYDRSGMLVGYAVQETTADAHPLVSSP